MPLDFVTQAQFGQTMTLLGEVRTMLREDITHLKDGQIRLSEQLEAVKTEITSRQDEANGRTESVEKAVTEIHDKGCGVYEGHRAAIALRVLPLNDQPPFVDRRMARVSPRVKRAAIGGGLVAGGVGLTELLPHVWSALHWVAHVLSGGAIK